MVSRARLLLAIVVAFAARPGHAQAPPPFSLGPLTAHAGERVSGHLEVPAGVDAATRIPITIVHGVRPGPVLAAIAGTHGYEYAPITALQRVRAELDPQELAGTLILVHIANLPSFLGRTIYYSPVDGLNLNRVYPGRADGTVSERIAHTITAEVIDRADVIMDLHGGDGNEALRPYAYWMQSGDAVLDARTRDLVIAFGLDHIVIDPDRPHDAGASVYTSNTALTRGKPGFTTETGRLGTNAEGLIDLAVRGVWNVLAYLGMVEGDVTLPTQIVWLEDYEVLRSPVTGIFRAAVQDGWYIAEGGLLGTLVDFFGDPVQEVRAPFAGVVNYVVATPPVSEGEPLAMVSKVVGR